MDTSSNGDPEILVGYSSPSVDIGYASRVRDSPAINNALYSCKKHHARKFKTMLMRVGIDRVAAFGNIIERRASHAFPATITMAYQVRTW
jgi:hypothetical protein